jgi:phosphoribosylanthranilate isomerase
VEKYNLDFIQLHGNESAHYCFKLFQELKLVNRSVQLVKAFGIDDQFDFSVLKEYEHSCDYFLFDTKTQDFGGSGTSFNKAVLKNYKLSKLFFISGGIGVEEVAELPHDARLLAIDVNSKFEIKPGLKDINKLKILQNELSGK